MADEAEEDVVVLVKKPNATSIVWNYFGLEANKGGTPKPDKNPICRSCKRSIPAKGGNTSNLMAHLKEHHAELYVEALSAQKSKDRLYNKRKNAVDSDSASTSSTGKQSARQSTDSIKEVLLASRKYTANSPQALELNKAVTYFIAKDAQPFSVVEKPGFKRIISKLNPRYQLPSRN